MPLYFTRGCVSALVAAELRRRAGAGTKIAITLMAEPHSRSKGNGKGKRDS